MALRPLTGATTPTNVRLRELGGGSEGIVKFTRRGEREARGMERS